MQQRVELVGILNVTPDSFSEDGVMDPHAAVRRANEIMREGASMLDVGAESTRPGATPLSHEEEWERLEPVIHDLALAYPDQISLDTYHVMTVRKATREGNVAVNDVTGFTDSEMIETVAARGLHCIVSHLPHAYAQDIQGAHEAKPVNSVEQVKEELMERYHTLLDAGVLAGRIILDPGIGFGKTPELNWELLKFAAVVPNIDVMIGYSRKRFLGKNRLELEPNLAAGRIAVEAGARYLRVHDVSGHLPLVQ